MRLQEFTSTELVIYVQRFVKCKTFLKHRYRDHYESVKPCRFEEKGQCNFKDQCWYKHRNSDKKDGGNYDDSKVTLRGTNDTHKCRVCGETFPTWPALMIHRKKMHYVRQCQNKNCRFGPAD